VPGGWLVGSCEGLARRVVGGVLRGFSQAVVLQGFMFRGGNSQDEVILTCAGADVVFDYVWHNVLHVMWASLVRWPQALWILVLIRSISAPCWARLVALRWAAAGGGCPEPCGCHTTAVMCVRLNSAAAAAAAAAAGVTIAA
jgi:hypothetical protein